MYPILTYKIGDSLEIKSWTNSPSLLSVRYDSGIQLIIFLFSLVNLDLTVLLNSPSPVVTRRVLTDGRSLK